ncbi:MAG: NmrA family NAD(P)-binding protein [Chloroflexi bacterium]|nr:NmrA family NAD(P)-binding protein [Chloroflexota bacterium]
MKILVTGATGTVGRQVVNQLIQAGHQVRALTRNPTKANLPDGVEVVAGDLAVSETLAPALVGVTGLHLINFDNGAGGNMLQTGAEIVALARQAGVRRVTVLRGGEKGSVEEALEASDLAWTFLQPVEFMANALDWVESIRTEGVVREPFGSRLSAMIHEADIGAVAATILGEDGHAGKTYTITGPEALTPPEMVHTIGAAIGRDLRFVELTEAQARQRRRESGYPEEVIEFFVWALGHTLEEGYTVVPTVEQVTGHWPRTFAQWAAEHAEVFCS